MDLSKMFYGFLLVVEWIFKIDTLIVFWKVIRWVFKCCSMFFLPFAKQNQDELWPRLQSSLMLLL